MLVGVANRFRPFFIKNYGFEILSNKFSILHEENVAPKKKKTIPIQRITLIANDNVSVATVEEAQKLAKRRDLKLVKILDLDTKTQRPLYKLMTGTEYHQADLKRREEKKQEKLNSTTIRGEKLLNLGSNISQHDLQININKVSKWLAKRYEVRVVINGTSGNIEKAESIYSFLETNLKDVGRILQKRQKGNDVRFQVTPPKKDNDNNDKKDEVVA